MSVHSQPFQHAHPHIAFIDSGIGGMSVLDEVKQAVPNMRVSYFMDNHFLPYGEQDTEFLVSRLIAIVKFLVATKPDLVVVACNTASTISLDKLRAKFNLPFVGVVPAIKPAGAMSINKHIGVLATKTTVQGEYLQDLITKYAADCQVTTLGSSELVVFAEHYFWHDNEKTLSGSFPDSFPDLGCFADVDTLVLGCTHFPLVKSQLAAKLSPHIKLVDSGQAIARRVKHLIGSEYQNEIEQGLSTGNILYCSSTLSDTQIQRLKDKGFNGVELTTL